MSDFTRARTAPRRRSTLLAAVFVCAGVMLTAQPRVDQEKDPASFDALYRRGSEKNAELKTLTARFVETTTSALLTQPLASSGTLAVQRPSKIVLHYREPEVRDLLIDGDRMTMSWPGRSVRNVINIAAANRRIQRYFVESTPAELRKSFDIASAEASDRPNAYKLTLTPRRQQIREGLRRLDLWLDRTSLLLAAMQMTFPTGDVKVMALDDVRVNVPLDAAVFSLDPTPAPTR
jgi:outer membrane lipoprotein-sorting protein